MRYFLPPKLLRCFAAFCFAFALLSASVMAATAEIGTVIAITPGASVLREGKTEALALSSTIRLADIVQTDSSGRVRILFNDDSSVSIGSNSSLSMSEYADQGSSSAFGAHLAHGLARVITGKIVNQNPQGFRMTAPKATVGIRGTIVSIRAERGAEKSITTVYVENTLRQVLVNGVVIPSGSKVVLYEDVMEKEELITPQDRRQLGRDLAFYGGQGVAATAPEPGGSGIVAFAEDVVATEDSLQHAGKTLVAQNMGYSDGLRSYLTPPPDSGSKPGSGHEPDPIPDPKPDPDPIPDPGSNTGSGGWGPCLACSWVRPDPIPDPDPIPGPDPVDPGTGPGPDPVIPTGTVAGQIEIAGGHGAITAYSSSNWSFTVNLITGAITNGVLSVRNGKLSVDNHANFNFSGGRGQAYPAGFEFTATGRYSQTGDSINNAPVLNNVPANLNVHGTADLGSLSTGDHVYGGYLVESPANLVSFGGTVKGVFTKQ